MYLFERNCNYLQCKFSNNCNIWIHFYNLTRDLICKGKVEVESVFASILLNFQTQKKSQSSLCSWFGLNYTHCGKSTDIVPILFHLIKTHVSHAPFNTPTLYVQSKISVAGIFLFSTLCNFDLLFFLTKRMY